MPRIQRFPDSRPMSVFPPFSRMVSTRSHPEFWIRDESVRSIAANGSSANSLFYGRFLEISLKTVKVVNVAPNALKVNKQLKAKVRTHFSCNFLVTWTSDDTELKITACIYIMKKRK